MKVCPLKQKNLSTLVKIFSRLSYFNEYLYFTLPRIPVWEPWYTLLIFRLNILHLELFKECIWRNPFIDIALIVVSKHHFSPCKQTIIWRMGVWNEAETFLLILNCLRLHLEEKGYVWKYIMTLILHQSQVGVNPLFKHQHTYTHSLLSLLFREWYCSLAEFNVR